MSDEHEAARDFYYSHTAREVVDELARLRLVEQAATALVDDYERRLQVTVNGKVQVDKRAIDALAAAVRTETPAVEGITVD